MAFILFGLFCVLFAENLVELDPISATADPTISCDDVTGQGDVICKSLPGCAWNDVNKCIVDPCLNLSTSTTQAQPPSGVAGGLTCVAPNANFSWAHATNCNANDYQKKDTYAHSSTSVELNKCSYIYLVNGSAPAPYCQLKATITGVPTGSNVNVGTPVVGCETDNNGELINICSCLGAWDVINGDSTNKNCKSYPKCYVDGSGVCVKDTCVDQATCASGCSAVQVLKPVISTGGVITGSGLEDICTNTQYNKSPNKCFYLIYKNASVTPLYCLPGLTVNKAQCDAVAECTTVTNAALYNNYFRTEYFCTDAEHAAPGAGYLIHMPSILILLLIVLSFLF